MKKHIIFILILTLSLFSNQAFSQGKIGISIFVGSSTIIPIGHDKIGDFPVKFSPGFVSSYSLSSYLPINNTTSIKADLGLSFLNGPGKEYRNNTNGVEKVMRLNIPLELVFHRNGIGGFIGIENGINFSRQKSYIGHLLKPYSCNISAGLCLFCIKGFYSSLLYSIDALAFARPGPKSWIINFSSTPHFHFGLIGVKFSYYPWTIKTKNKGL